jgi:hypothetical protein
MASTAGHVAGCDNFRVGGVVKLAEFLLTGPEIEAVLICCGREFESRRFAAKNLCFYSTPFRN